MIVNPDCKIQPSFFGENKGSQKFPTPKKGQQFVLKCQTESFVKSHEIYLNPHSKEFCKNLIYLLDNYFGHSVIQNSTITVKGNFICVCPKNSLLGGNCTKIKTCNTISWQASGSKNEFRLQQNGSWYQLYYSLADKVPEIRSRLMNEIMCQFPFKSTITFSPSDSDLIMRFYIPNTKYDENYINHVKKFLQGTESNSSTSTHEHEMMKIDNKIATNHFKFRIVSPRNLIELKDAVDNALFAKLKTILKVDEICLFHFTSFTNSKDQLAIKRQIKNKGILSKVLRLECPLLSHLKLGITTDADTKHKDHHYVHCFLGYPSSSNDKRYRDRLPDELQGQEPLKIAFAVKRGTIFLPFDQTFIKNHKFTFLGKEYTISINEKTFVITYFKEKEPLFSHHFKDEIFCESQEASDSSSGVDGMILLLSKFVQKLDPKDQKALFSDKGSLLKELFNDLFAFRTQISFPEQLRYKEYSHPNAPKVKLQKLVNQQKVEVPCLRQCKLQFNKLLKSMNLEKPLLSNQVRSSINAITNFFKQEFNLENAVEYDL